MQHPYCVAHIAVYKSNISHFSILCWDTGSHFVSVSIEMAVANRNWVAILNILVDSLSYQGLFLYVGFQLEKISASVCCFPPS